MAVAVIMVLSPASLAVRPHAFAGASSTYSLTSGAGGCGKVKEITPTWSAKTGIGHWSGSANTPCASKGIGGVGATNYAEAMFSQNIFIPITLTSSNVGANLSINFVGSWSEAISGSLGSTCPMTYSYNYSYYAYYYSPPTWINSTDTYGSCALESFVNLYGYVSLIDETTGSYIYGSSYWSGVNHINEQTASSSVYTTNYSNPAWWGNNYTSYSSYGTLRGSNGAGTFQSLPSGHPTWWFNSTFTTGDNYVFSVSVSGEAYASTTGARHGTAMAAMNLAAPSNGMAYSDAAY
jgi:hypothetical protein